MSTREQLIKALPGVLALAQQLENIRLASKRAGISKTQFYEIKAARSKCGPDRIHKMTGQFPTCSAASASASTAGTIKGVGKISMQTAIHAHCSRVFAKPRALPCPIMDKIDAGNAASQPDCERLHRRL